MMTRTHPGDQYHAFTARLAASGYQRTSMRVVAGCILALGLPAILAGLAPPAAPWPGFRLVYAALALVTVVLAVPWLRYRWPTRRESTAVVVLGTVALAAGCLATIDPLAGLLVAASFPFILGFTALFHSRRLLVFTAAVTAVTVVWLVVRIAAKDVATALAVSIPIALLCVVVTFGCRTIATVGAPEEADIEIEPLTGLLNRDSFNSRAATLLGARNRADDRYLVVTVIDIDGLTAIASLHGGRGVKQALVAAAQALRETTRKDAVVGHLSESQFLVADIFTVPDPGPLVERVRGAIAATPTGITASIGVVTTPLMPLVDRPPAEVLDGLIALGVTAMSEARSAGGDQARCVVEPDLGLT